MALDGRDYTKRDKNGNIDYSKNIHSKDLDEFVNESYKAALNDKESNAKYCEYCKKELKTSYNREKVLKNRIQDGIVSSYFVNEVIVKYESEQCTTCKKYFCHECMDSVRDISYDAVLNGLCPKCSKKFIGLVNEIEYNSAINKSEPSCSKRDDFVECRQADLVKIKAKLEPVIQPPSEPVIKSKPKPVIKPVIKPKKYEISESQCKEHTYSRTRIGNDFSGSQYEGVCIYCGNKKQDSDFPILKHTGVRKKSNIPYSKIFTILALISVLSIIWFYGDDIFPSDDFNENVFNPSLGIINLKASGEPVVLINNESATNPTWDELITFLKTDDTDRILYKDDVFVCSDFAERLHNNAEQAGIRAAFVTIYFYSDSDGHALNAFETTDKGLTYVDCTGSDVKLQELDSFDKIAYVEKGKEYGIVSIHYTNTPEYEFYELRKDNVRLRGFFESMGVVKEVDIYWKL
ncbi:hypothetical protein [Methanolobus sp.]|uniref:hypothetical protein n=1 Tax=Methanolobus sp. TaxID=1874737 RepID=UPI0025F4CCF5|nr:hypothetical protein [Methanolobus sp.]